jgi:hypothetical protein
LTEDRSTVGHSTLLSLTDEQFTRLLTALEHAFLHDAAAFYYRQAEGPTLIDLFDRKRAEIDDAEWAWMQPALPYLDQFLLYAFEEAPASIIRAWADDHGEGFGDTAISRIEAMRESAPILKREWRRRAQGVGSRTLGDLQARVILDLPSGSFQAVLRIDSFVPGQQTRRQPVSSSQEWLTATVSRGEISRLISILERARTRMPNLDLETLEDEGAGDERI